MEALARVMFHRNTDLGVVTTLLEQNSWRLRAKVGVTFKNWGLVLIRREKA